MAPSARYVPARSIEKSPTASEANGAPPSTQTCDPSSKPRDDAASAPSTPYASPSKVARSPSQRDNRKRDVSNYSLPPWDVAGTFTLSDTPVVQILNYTNVDFYLPFESLPVSDGGSPYPNWVVLGSTSFTDAPVVQSFANGHFQNASLNFYDNANDTGGSDPGGPDNLALGDTNFAYNPGQSPLGLSVSDIGHDTVQVDSNAITTTITDYGAGVFEIGATDATTLAASTATTTTSHLI